MMKKVHTYSKKILFSCMMLGALQYTLHADMNDNPLESMFLMDKFEVFNNDEKTKAWEGSFWLGYDINKLFIYSQGEATSSGVDTSQNELVYSRAIAPFWNIEAGVAYDKNDNSSRTWGEVAIAGLAPYFFETRAALLVNGEGNVGLRLDLEYEALFTQKLILTPSLEADFYTQDDAKMGTGAGLSSMEAGLRLRYEIRREFAPYIGVNWEKTFGNTRDYTPINETNILLGLRFWF